MDEIISFGDWVKERRRVLDLTQEELARRVGCATSTIKKIELEQRRPSKVMAERLARLLGLAPEEHEQFVRAARGTLSADAWLGFPPPVPAPSTTSRKLLKSYELREQLGSGAHGTVFRAYQAAIRRDVAVKIIAPPYASRPAFIRRFEHEAQLVARLEHPHIVPLFDYWRDPSGAYLVMRWMRGGNLHMLLEHAPLSLAAILRLLEQIAGALTVAHRQDIVHRDLKPSNILLDEHHNAYLADFGIAKDVRTTAPADCTSGETPSTSPAYSAPEQTRGEQVTPRTDIYSLGILLYELLTGTHPFAATRGSDLIVQHLAQPRPSLIARRPDLPPALEAIVARAVATDPAQRYPDALSLLADLQATSHSGTNTAARAPVEHMLPGTTMLPGASADGDRTIAAIAAPVENPYKGLRAFQEADARDFFGREALTQHLLSRLAERDRYARFLVVVGASGSGKSSVVRAGLVPALRRGALPAATAWFFAEMLPGNDPFAALETALLGVAVDAPPGGLQALLRGDERGLLRAVEQVLPPDRATELLLVIDQLEEVFTLVEDEAVRARFLTAVLTAAGDVQSRVRIVATLRADFYDRPLAYAGFGDLVRRRTAVVVALTPQELELTIVQPAGRVGVRVEAALATAMVAEMEGQPGTLPLLQYALTDLFERRSGNDLTMEAYRANGGLLGALARRADGLVAELDDEAQEATRQLFLRLLTVGDGAEVTRRRVPLAELAGSGTSVSVRDCVIERFAMFRLLTLDRDPATRSPTVEVAHEALITSWERLRGWLAASREDIRMQQRLAAAAAEWTAAGHEPSFLATGARLAQFAAWSTESSVRLNTQEQAFLQHSRVAHAQLQRAEQERLARELALAHESAAAHRSAARRLRYLAGLLALFLLVALGLSAVALRSRATAVASFAQSDSQRLAAEANGVLQRGESGELAALLALRGLQADYSTQADAALQRAARFDYGVRLFAHPDSVGSAVYAPDGKTILTGSNDTHARLWDLHSGQELRRFTGHTDVINSVALSPDGAYVLTGSADRTARLWDAHTGRELRRLAGHTGAVAAVAFSPSGTYVLTAGADETIRLWDVPTGAQRLLVATPGLGDCCPNAAISPDDRYLATGNTDGTAQLWDAATGQPVRTFSGHSGWLYSVAFSPDGNQLLTASLDKTARLWNTTTGDLIQTFTGHTDLLFQAVFSPDGKRIVTGSLDTTARLWDVVTGKELRRYTAQTASVYTVAFAPDGSSVLTGSKDGTARLWDIRAPAEAETFAGHTSIVYGLAFSPDGASLLTGSLDTTARLWDVATGTQLRVLPHARRVDSAAFSPDGAYVLTGGQDGTRLWDTATGAEVRRYGDFWSHGSRFSADGRYVVTNGPDFTVDLWDRETGERVRSFGGPAAPSGVGTLSPDGRVLLTVNSLYNDARLWDAATGKQLHVLIHPAGVNRSDFSPDGRYVVTASRDNIARLWEVATGQLVGQFVGHTNILWSAAFSPDGRTVLTASQDRSARLWDVATGKQLRYFPGHASAAVSSAIFSPDGRTVAIGSFDGSVQVTRTDLTSLVESICARVLRDVTTEERAIYGIAGGGPTCHPHVAAGRADACTWPLCDISRPRSVGGMCRADASCLRSAAHVTTMLGIASYSAGTRRNQRSTQHRPGKRAQKWPGTPPGIGVTAHATTVPFHGPAVPAALLPLLASPPSGPPYAPCGAAASVDEALRRRSRLR